MSHLTMRDVEVDEPRDPADLLTTPSSTANGPVYGNIFDLLDPRVHPKVSREVDLASILDEDSADSDDEDTAPVRVLSGFCLFNWETLHLAALHEPIIYGASGVVTTCTEDRDSEDEDDVEDKEKRSASALLGPIEEFWLDDRDLGTPEIWFRTDESWYILNEPSSIYDPLYRPLFTVHLLACVVSSTLQASRAISYDGFLDFVESGAWTKDLAGRPVNFLPLSKDDVLSHKEHPGLLKKLLQWKGYSKHKYSSVLVNIIGSPDELAQAIEEFTRAESDPEDKNYKTSRARPGLSGPKYVETEILKHRNMTMITPTIARITKDLFAQEMMVIGSHLADDKDVKDKLQSLNHNASLSTPVVHSDNPKVKWGEPEQDYRGYYKSVFLDGVEYRIGDTVAVEAGEDEDLFDASNAALESAQSTNALANSAWFCIIEYFFEKKGVPMFHCRWFVHGSKTLLAETSSPSTLFLMNKCDDNPVTAILQHCAIHQLQPGERQPTLEMDSVFYYRFIWDRDSAAYFDPDPHAQALIHKYCEPEEPCYSCALQFKADEMSQCTFSEDSITFNGKTYHQGDFVYIRLPDSQLLGITQIVGWDLRDNAEEDKRVEVLLYRKHGDLPPGLRKKHHLEERHVYLLPGTHEISAYELSGHCTVKHKDFIKDLELYITQENHYFIDQEATCHSPYLPEHFEDIEHSQLQTCIICMEREENDNWDQDMFFHNSKKLRALELFSGAGGLSLGMELSGFVESKWAVEFSPSACKTFKANHPDSLVYNQDVNLTLKHAIDTAIGKKPNPLPSLHSPRVKLPSMPRPGEVDLIMGGPPCQSFSGMNRHKRVDDIRNTLVCNMLSYVEFYQPSYFLLENVTGMLSCSLNGEQHGMRIVGGVKLGIVKFIVCALTTLGYQTRLNVLHAAHYGTPQTRNRVIVLGSKSGIPLPAFPIPTHIPRKMANSYKLGTVGILKSLGSELEDGTRVCAPQRAVTVRDAIGDLPKYDWKNPHTLLRATTHDKMEEAQRARQYAVLNAVKGADRRPGNLSGYLGEEPYGHRPHNLYQAFMRRKVPKDGGVRYHYTGYYMAPVVEITVNIPLQPYANFSDLPRGLMRPKKTNRTPVSKTYIRLDGGGYFRTAMTVITPQAKECVCLHPTQKRVITVRECARAQGFPDDYQIESTSTDAITVLKDQHRQIGNAVPVPLALALGRSLGTAAMNHWLDQRHAMDNEVSMEVDE